MIPKPKYIENILEVTKQSKNFIYCDVVCECKNKTFTGYTNILPLSKEQKEHENELKKFYKKYNTFTTIKENEISYLCGMKGLFKKKIGEKIEIKNFDYTQIVKIKCLKCGKEYILFDSRFHGYDANIPERESMYDNNEYDFTPIKWKNDIEGASTFHIKIENDESLENFIENAYETNNDTYSNSFSWIQIEVKNIKTNNKQIIIDEETA